MGKYNLRCSIIYNLFPPFYHLFIKYNNEAERKKEGLHAANHQPLIK